MDGIHHDSRQQAVLRRDNRAEANMTSAEGDINEMVFGMTVAIFRHYAEMRIGEGVSNEQLNAELKQFIPVINKWARRERILLRLMLNDPPSHALQ